MKIHLKHLFLVLPLLIAVTIFWYLQQPFGLESNTDSPLSLENSPSGSLITDIQLVEFEGTSTRWTLNAPSALRQGEENVTVHNPSLTIYKKNGKSVSIHASVGSINTRSKSMIFTGDVSAKNETLHLQTDRLQFDPVKQILYTNHKFKLISKNILLEGVGLTLYQETKKLTVSHRVKVHYSHDKEDKSAPWNS